MSFIQIILYITFFFRLSVYHQLTKLWKMVTNYYSELFLYKVSVAEYSNVLDIREICTFFVLYVIWKHINCWTDLWNTAEPNPV